METMVNLSTGNVVVDEMAKINITGNITPVIWFKTIQYPNGKANTNAINLLSDIVYWYRPREKRDEYSGQIIGYEKKFKEDKLQRNYQQIADKLGITKNQALAAVNALEGLGVVTKEFRNIEANGLRLNNVLYLGLVPERLLELTYPSQTQCLSVCNYNQTGVQLELGRVSNSNPIGVQVESDTNTEITTKITNRDYINPIVSTDTELNAPTLDDVKAQLDYEALCHDYKYEMDKIDGIVNIIHDILLLEDTKKVQINRQKITASKVKKRFEELNMMDIQYVVDGINSSEKKVTNMRAYLLTSLYNAPDTRSSYMANWVQSDRAKLIEKQHQQSKTYNGMSFDELEQELLSNHTKKEND